MDEPTVGQAARRFRINDYPLLRMAQIVAATQQLIARGVDDPALSTSSWRVIAMLAERRRMTVKGLAEAAAIERTSVSRLVMRLEEAGLVQRGDNPLDGRSSHLLLTDKGQDLYGKLVPAARDAMAQALGGLSPEELERLIGMLDGMLENLGLPPVETQVECNRT